MEYNDTPGGLSSNDDAGRCRHGTSSLPWDFIPVCPATPYYMLSSPTFKVKNQS